MGGDDGDGVGWGDGADGWEFVLKTKERNWVLKARTALERDRWVDTLVQLSPAVSGFTEEYTRGAGSSRNLLRGGGEGGAQEPTLADQMAQMQMQQEQQQQQGQQQGGDPDPTLWERLGFA